MKLDSPLPLTYSMLVVEIKYGHLFQLKSKKQMP